MRNSQEQHDRDSFELGDRVSVAFHYENCTLDEYPLYPIRQRFMGRRNI